LNQVTKSTTVEDTDEIPAPSSSMPERNQAQKRKSPEVALTLARDSPEQKRSTPNVEWDNVATHFGIPSDLNKLKKEELLVMLEGYGIHSLSMKDYKKDLVDTLKSHLELEYCSSIRSRNDVQMLSEPSSSSEMIQSDEPIQSQETLVENVVPVVVEFPSSQLKELIQPDDIPPIPVINSFEEQSNQTVEVSQDILPEPSTLEVQEEGGSSHDEDGFIPQEELTQQQQQIQEVVAPNPAIALVNTSVSSSDQVLVKKPSNLPVKISSFVDKPTVVRIFYIQFICNIYNINVLNLIRFYLIYSLRWKKHVNYESWRKQKRWKRKKLKKPKLKNSDKSKSCDSAKTFHLWRSVEPLPPIVNPLWRHWIIKHYLKHIILFLRCNHHLQQTLGRRQMGFRMFKRSRFKMSSIYSKRNLIRPLPLRQCSPPQSCHPPLSLKLEVK